MKGGGSMQRAESEMPWFDRSEDEEKYREWLREHHDTGFVLNCYFYPNGDAAMLHLAACGTLLAQDDLVHASPSYPKKCGDALDDLLNWAARELDVKIKGCSSCLKGAGHQLRLRQ
jgi:hypothetical protein